MRYYISEKGNDNNAGTQASPFKTIDKINRLTLAPGDFICFKRGEIFRGQLNISADGINVWNYGAGTDPAIISGCSIITGWQQYQGNIYYAPCSFAPKMFFINGVMQLKGRYPETGYLTAGSNNTNTRINCSALTQPSNYLAGTTAHIKPDKYLWAIETVGSSGNGYINLSKPAEYALRSGYGFFFTNKIDFLKHHGQWCYDAVAKRIYAYFDNYPALTEASNNYDCIKITGNKANINGIRIIGANENGIEITGNDAYINKVTIDGCYKKAIQTNGGNNLTVINSTINNIYGKGIMVYGTTGTVLIQKNIFKNIGLIEGIACEGEIPYTAVELAGLPVPASVKISFNSFDSIGYLCVRFSQNAEINDNRMEDFCMTTDDGAAIYTWGPKDGGTPNGTNCYIHENEIGGGIGNNNAIPAQDAQLKAAGVYIDDKGASANIYKNLINDVKWIGIFCHNASNCNIDSNVIDNTGDACFKVQADNDGGGASGNVVKNNFFSSSSPNVPCVAIWNYLGNTFSGLASFSGNNYDSPSGMPVSTMVAGGKFKNIPASSIET